MAVEQAKAVADRLRPLLGRHEVSEQQLFDAEKAVEQAEIQQQTAEAQLQVMMIGPRPEAVAEAEGKIKTADALVAFSQAHLEYHTIRAPIDGVLDSLTCHPGQTIAIGSPIGEVVDSRQVFASVWLPPRSAWSVHVGQAARVWPADALDHVAERRGPGEEGMAGKVAFVGRVADPQTGNLPIRDPGGQPAGTAHDRAVGPGVDHRRRTQGRRSRSRLRRSSTWERGRSCSVVRDGKSVVLHPEVGRRTEGWTEVSGTDLKEGEPVIVEGGYNLPEETPVKLAGEEKDATARSRRAKAKARLRPRRRRRR